MYSIRLVKSYLDSWLFKDLSLANRQKEFVVISPDAGATKRTLKFAKKY